ncbi:MAG: YkgJ family cysteine cluster protein [Gammaproteobacteria bacterium]|nr:MAG: YkgJ family cysteine cluster protein [Gammaproteobacteria bacterium]
MNPENTTERLSFPADEPVHPWLSRLLEAYHITDAGVCEGIRREELQGRKLACSKGCAACCRSHTTIPVYPLELIGISWYVTEKIRGSVREQLHKQLLNYRDQDGCPFLVDEICSIHELRPMACRQFNVFDTVCSEGEDAWYTRRKDVLTPLKEYTDRAFDVMLPFYGIEKKSERRKVIRDGTIHGIARVLKDCNWSSLAEKMTHHDSRLANNG